MTNFLKITCALFLIGGMNSISFASQSDLASVSSDETNMNISDGQKYTAVAKDGSGWKVRFTVGVDDPNDPWSNVTCSRIEWYHPTKKVWYDAVIIKQYMTGPSAMRAIVKSKDSGKFYSYDFSSEGFGDVTEYNGKVLTYEEENDSQVREKDDASKLSRVYKAE